LRYPVCRIVLTAARCGVSCALRIGAHLALVILAAVGEMAGHDFIGRDSLLDPIYQRRKTVPSVRTWPPPAVPHTRKHEEPNSLSRRVFVAVERRLEDFLVVIDCRLRLALRIGPSVIKKKLPAFAKKKT